MPLEKRFTFIGVCHLFYLSFDYGKLNRFPATRLEKRNQPREKEKGRGNKKKEERKKERKIKTEKN